MLAIVPSVTDMFSPMVGYISVLAIYWIGFCLPVALFYGQGSKRVTVSIKAPKLWIFALALALPVLVCIAANPARWVMTAPTLVGIAIICALINGPLEELAWRRPFRANSDGRFSFELLGLGLFTMWHVPLYFSKGVSFDHGALGLVGGAFILGAVWTFMTRASDSVGWPMVSHALVNVMAFIPMFVMNFAD